MAKIPEFSKIITVSLPMSCLSHIYCFSLFLVKDVIIGCSCFDSNDMDKNKKMIISSNLDFSKTFIDIYSKNLLRHFTPSEINMLNFEINTTVLYLDGCNVKEHEANIQSMKDLNHLMNMSDFRTEVLKAKIWNKVEVLNNMVRAE